MKVKVSEASGNVLDWMVAKCEGIAVEYINDGITKCLLMKPSGRYTPSTDWAQGGPIIEREIVSLDREEGGRRWKALAWRSDLDLQSAIGHTPLIAAMRCYVASKLGEEVEVPDELV